MHDGTSGSYTAEDVSTSDNGQAGYGVFSTGEGGNISFIDGAISTTGDDASGVVTSAGGTVNIDNSVINTSGSSAYGALANPGGGVLNITNSKINVTGNRTRGVHSEGGNAVITNTEITTSGEIAYGISAMNGGGNITFRNGTINSAGRYGIGAFATGAGNTIDISDSQITTLGSSAPGVYVTNGGIISLENTDVHSDKTYAMQADGNSVINYDGGTISNNSNTEALYARTGGTLNVKNATINTNGYGFTGTSSTKLNADNVIFNITGTHVGVYGYAYSDINLKNTQINMLGSNQTGIQLRDHSKATLDNVTINALNNWDGIVIGAETSLNATNLRLNMSSATDGGSNPARGLLMGSGSGAGNVSLTDSRIEVAGDTGTAVYARSGTQTLSLDNSLISAESGTGIVTQSGATMLVNASGSNISGKTLVSAALNSNTTLNGKDGSMFAGDIANSGGTINLNLDSGSSWKGATDSLQQLSMSDGSTWSVSGNSGVELLNLNNSTIDLHTQANGFNTLTVGELTSAGGTLRFGTKLFDDASETDKLHITGDYSGNTNVMVSNAGGTGAQTIDGIELISVDGAVNGTFSQQGRIVAGAYDYNLVQKGNKWLLDSKISEKPVDPVDPEKPVDPVDPEIPVVPGGPGETGESGGSITPPSGPSQHIVRPEAASYAANLASANTLFATSLHDRLGETAYVDSLGQQHVTSMWLRNKGGHNRFKDSSGQLSSTGNRYVVQLGGDVSSGSTDGSDRFHLGVMGGYARAQTNTHSAVSGYSSKGNIHGYSTGLYATWLQNDEENRGGYIDSWALYNWFDNSVKGQDIGQENYKSKGITASIEGGYTFKLGEANKLGYYLQPQAQLTWMGVKADNHQEQNGTRVRDSGENNVQTRLGARIFLKGHNHIDDGKNRTFEPYIEANWVANTKAFGSKLNDVQVSQSGSRNIGELKAGVEGQINPNLNLWGNIGQQLGAKGYSDSSAMVGLKVNF